MITITFENFLLIIACILFILWISYQLKHAAQDESGTYDDSGIVDVYGSKGYRYLR